MTISYDADEEFSRIFENTHGAEHRHRAREGILRDIAGEWNERSPASIHMYIKNDYSPAKWGRVLVIGGGEPKSFEKIQKTEYAAYGAKHRRARSARGDGE